MLPNLSALKQQPTGRLANANEWVGVQRFRKREPNVDPITAEDWRGWVRKREGDGPAPKEGWILDVDTGDGKRTPELKYLYDIDKLAQHLVRNGTSPISRLPAHKDDMRECIIKANQLRMARDPNAELLPVPEEDVVNPYYSQSYLESLPDPDWEEPRYAPSEPEFPPLPDYEEPIPWDDLLDGLPPNENNQRLPQYLGFGPNNEQFEVMQRLAEGFEREADTKMLEFAAKYDDYLRDYPNEEQRRYIELKSWVGEHCNTARAVYGLWDRAERMYQDAQNIQEELPPADEAGIFGNLVYYAQRMYARRRNELLRQQRIQKYKTLAEAASAHGAAVCQPIRFNQLTTAGPVYFVGFGIGPQRAMQWADGVLHSTSVESLERFDGMVRRLTNDMQRRYGNEIFGLLPVRES